MQKFGVRVLTISPGFVRTPLTAHNPYKMPFIMEPEEFAREAVKAILSDKTYVTIPWQMGWLGKLLRILPNPVFDRILAKRKQKPRAGAK
jgi:short-subunit dehydrogenase